MSHAQQQKDATVKEGGSAQQQEEPHSCRCSRVAECHIFVHPDARVQAALNTLVEEIARCDDETGTRTLCQVFSLQPDGGSFVSITKNALSHGSALAVRATEEELGALQWAVSQAEALKRYATTPAAYDSVAKRLRSLYARLATDSPVRAGEEGAP